MAKGDIVVFNEAKQNIANGLLNLSTAGDFKVMLITTLPTAADVTPHSTDYTQVSGGTSYVAGGKVLAVSWDIVGTGVAFHSSTDPLWLQDASGPSNIRAALVYSITAGTENALCFIDMTGGGTIDLATGDIGITWPAAGLFTLT